MNNRVFNTLQSVFGFSSFKKNQEAIVSSILDGRDVFAAMPTGGGKSLCYQLPSILLPGITVVVSPLIALMKDQVDSAVQIGISAAYINSSLDKDKTIQIYRDLQKNKIKLLYISPERFALTTFIQTLSQLNISLFAIDEAHCLSDWGHDFRPDYLSLTNIRKFFPNTVIAAFTATATKQVQSDIIYKLDLIRPFITRASFDRPELSYRVVRKSKTKDQLLKLTKDRVGKAGIIYRTSRNDVEKTAAFLVANGIKALPYHAGLEERVRTGNQEKFNCDETDVIVATIAFGMGIDKSNIKYVIHGDLPKNIEGYYQETGRAGRDGSDSECILLFSRGDSVKINYFINKIEDIHEQEKSRHNLNKILRYASRNVCRRKQLLSYFEEEHPGNCNNCDVCNNENELIDITVDSQMILSAIARTGQKFGINHTIDVVRGSKSSKILKFEHDKIKTFGIGKSKTKEFWHLVIDELLGQECLIQDSERYNALVISEKGTDLLYGRIKTTMFKPVIEKSKKSREAITLTKDEELFERLRRVRLDIAKEKNVPPYVVFSDKTLTDMSNLKPRNSEEFLLVNGVGEKKLESYGDQFLGIIIKYL
ncbi:DNA helicase RecQ [Thiospirochaeta perfilievii]|uniref:DNA helicase RecQ n=1 Tax=Thiospirochaeta perfilievii TaxID=252967 RepID=A0A5C1Q911_9SPIO|nr:DNA helicase RecQ [Thiospirochaeta perfilievii]QEN03540.1 DNA helicase RecQ [Thiospirochaeta perfilievii]